MAKITYSKTSPYATTTAYGFFLDVAQIRDIPYDPSDVTYAIDAIYKYRPDLLAFDLYGDSALWWVFRARNPNVIDDPIFDFKSGVTIMIPKKTTLVSNLGL